MIDRAFVWQAGGGWWGCCGSRSCRGYDGGRVVVCVVMPFQVVKGARYRRPGFWPVHGMHSVVLRLPRTDRGECIVGVEHLDRAIHIPIGGGTQGGVEDSAVFVNGYRSACIRTHWDWNITRIAGALSDDVVAVAIGERERGARRGIPASCQVIGQEPLAEVTRQRTADCGAAFKRGGTRGNARGGQRRVVDARIAGIGSSIRGRRLSGSTRHVGGARLVDIGEVHLV